MLQSEIEIKYRDMYYEELYKLLIDNEFPLVDLYYFYCLISEFRKKQFDNCCDVIYSYKNVIENKDIEYCLIKILKEH